LNALFSALRDNPPKPPAVTTLEDARKALDGLKQVSTLSKPQTERLDACIAQATSPKADVGTLVDDCLLIVTVLKNLSDLKAADLDRIRLLRDFAKDVRDEHQSFRTFWLQAGQLILLNLLLPLLTALLGYIFGAQQAQAQRQTDTN
jgi:hypothetical protein